MFLESRQCAIILYLLHITFSRILRYPQKVRDYLNFGVISFVPSLSATLNVRERVTRVFRFKTARQIGAWHDFQLACMTLVKRGRRFMTNIRTTIPGEYRATHTRESSSYSQVYCPIIITSSNVSKNNFAISVFDDTRAVLLTSRKARSPEIQSQVKRS